MKPVDLNPRADFLIPRGDILNYRVYKLDSGGKNCSGCCDCCKQKSYSCHDEYKKGYGSYHSDKTVIEYYSPKYSSAAHFSLDRDRYDQDVFAAKKRLDTDNFYYKYWRNNVRNYDPRCPYCINVMHRTALQCCDHKDETNSDNEGRYINGIVRAADGREVSIMVSDQPDERLPANELGTKSEWRVWNNTAGGESHTIINISDVLIECFPKVDSVHISSYANKNDWLNEYHHAGAVEVGANVHVAFSNSRPHTHIWALGASIHMNELVSISLAPTKL